MIAVNFEHVDSRGPGHLVLSGMRKLNNTPNLSAKGIYRLLRLTKEVDGMIRDCEMAMEKLAEKHSKKGEDGKPIKTINPDKTWRVEIENWESFEGDQKELFDQSTKEIPINRLPVADWEKAGLTPAEVSALEFCLEIPVELEAV